MVTVSVTAILEALLFFNLMRKFTCCSIDNTAGKFSFGLIMVPAHI